MSYSLSNYEESGDRLSNLCIISAKIIIKYGGQNTSYTESHIRELWSHGIPYPSVNTLKKLDVKNIKWFIHKFVTFDDGVWNGNFLHGMATNGEIIFDKDKYPSFKWSNKGLEKIIEASSFGGVRRKNSWRYVAAFYLNYSSNSTSFMAGVLSGGILEERNDVEYAKYSGNTIPYIKEWGIPIEFEDDDYILISVFWPALFSFKMPVESRAKWYNIRSIINAKHYAAILWKTYVDCHFMSEAIPYLNNARTIFYRYKDYNGSNLKSGEQLKFLRVEMGLTGLHNGIKECVQTLAKQYKEKKLNRRNNEILID